MESLEVRRLFVAVPGDLIAGRPTSDYGDAPDTYGTTLASNGPQHLQNGAMLGATRTNSEGDGQPSANADADGGDDGIFVGVASLQDATLTGPEATLTIAVTGGSGFVNGWIDFNASGAFDPAERVVANVAVATGSTNVQIAIPATVVSGTTYARFRLTTTSLVTESPVGGVASGEVEDYKLTLSNPQSLVVTTATDEDDGTSNPAIGTGTSLREAIAWANANPGDDVITFDETAFPDGSLTTITLDGTQLVASEEAAKVTIQGLGSRRVAISGNNESPIIYSDSALELSGLLLTKGGESGYGGAVFTRGKLTILDSAITDNKSSSGGAVAALSGDVRIERTTFSGNSTSSGGGALLLGDVNAVIRDSSFYDNSTSGFYGGAILALADNFGTTVTAINCTFSGNSATGDASGGAVGNYALDSSAGVIARTTLIHCTITDNSVGNPGRGGGIYSDVADPETDISEIRLINTIVSGNRRGTSAPDDIVAFGGFTGTHSLIGEQAADGVVLPDGVDGNIVGVTDPGLAPLADNGGPTLTHQLLTTSPALNKGDDASAVDEIGNPLDSDQRADAFAFPRIVGSRVDIGAAELPPADLTIDDLTIDEGDSGFTAFTFTVKRSYDDGFASVDWFTSDGLVPGAIAQAGSDYVGDLGTVTFAEGELESTLTVSVYGDTNIETDQQFLVTLDAPLNAQLKDPLAVGTIRNDDSGPPKLSINDVSITEGDSGLKNMNFSVTLDKRINQPVTFKYGTVSGTATAGSDFVAKFGTATIPAFGRTAVLTIQVKGDTLIEGNETFLVKLKEPTGAIIADDTGVGTIVNNDALPKIRINNAPNVVEGNSGTKLMTFTVTLDKASTSIVSVKYATADGTAKASLNDYKSKSGTLTFNAGQTSRTITVTIVGDTRKGVNETVLVNLTSPIGATIADGQGVGTILNDD